MCAAETCVRILAFPCGTTGNENPITYTPSPSIRSAIFAATAASPSMIGVIGCVPGTMLNPLPAIAARKCFVLDSSLSRSSDVDDSSSTALIEAATIGGGAGRYLMRAASQHLAVGAGFAWTNENYSDADTPTKDSAEAYFATEFMTEKLKITDFITRFTYYPSLTIDDRYRLAYRFDFDFNLPGDWYLRVGFFDNYDSQPPEGFSSNDYGWSNAFGFKF